MVDYSFRDLVNELNIGLQLAKEQGIRLDLDTSNSYESRFKRKLEELSRELLFNCSPKTEQRYYEKALIAIEESAKLFGRNERGANQINRLLKLILKGRDYNLSIPARFDSYLPSALKLDLQAQ